MQIISQDFKKNIVKLKLTDHDDIWYLSTLIEPNDYLSGATTRKIKLGTDENAKVIKKIINVTIEVESVQFASAGIGLRINGKITQGPEDVPKDSYQSITLEVHDICTLEKSQFLSHHKQKLQEATEKKYSYLLCLFDREESLFALTKTRGYEIILSLRGDVPKKAQTIEIKKDFHQEIISLLESYNQRFHPEKIIIASPAFYKEDLIKKINQPELKTKIIPATCSDISETSINEVLKSPELKNTLQTSRSREEQLLVEELLSAISKNGPAVYGFKEVKSAGESGAIKTLLITENCIQHLRQQQKYQELDLLLKIIDSNQGKVHIISSEHDGGKKLDGLGGIAAILRYNLSW